MRILIVHNHYGRYSQGGEANVVEMEAKLLADHGHEVMKYERTNAEIYEGGSLKEKIRMLFYVAWSKRSYDEIKKVIQKFKPDIMHVHNYWIILTPSIFAAAKDCSVKTILTLHNYRLICPGGQFVRRGNICELCLKGNPYRILYYRCYPGGSFLKSYLSLILYAMTKRKAFLKNLVDSYIALTNFGRKKFIEGGLPSKKIFVKPNFMNDPIRDISQVNKNGKGALFAGRISVEKGILTLIKAWKGVAYPLFVVGDGPLIEKARITATGSVNFLGWKSHGETLKLLNEAEFFIFPSELYEGFPLSLLEAMAMGKAIIASDLGPRREIIENNVTGLLFEAGNENDLREKIVKLIHDKALRERLGKAARETYLERYTPEKNYKMLMDIYKN